MLGFFFSLISTRLRAQLSGLKLQLLYIFQDLLTLFILYQTSESFSALKDSSHSLFGYMLLGELVLRLPTSLIFTPFERIRPWIESGALEYATGFRGGVKRVIFFEALSYALIDLLRCLLTLLICSLFFSSYLSSELLWRAVSVEILSTPLFLLIGLASMPLSLFFRSGRMIVGRLIGLMAIFSGGYFPLKTLGESFSLLSYINPLSLYISAIRDGFSLVHIGALFLLTCISFGLYQFCSFSLERALKSGRFDEILGAG